MPQPWSVLQSRHTYEDPWLRVRTDTCQLPSGRVIDSYHVLEYPDWVNVVAVTPHLDVVLVRQYRHPVGRVLTELPAGIVDPSDVSPEAAIRRELEEETGYRGGVWRCTGRAYANPASCVNVVWSFAAVGVEPGEAHPDANEEIEVVRIPLLELMERVWRGEEILQRLHTASLFFLVGSLRQAHEPEWGELRQALRSAWAW